MKVFQLACPPGGPRCPVFSAAAVPFHKDPVTWKRENIVASCQSSLVSLASPNFFGLPCIKDKFVISQAKGIKRRASENEPHWLACPDWDFGSLQSIPSSLQGEQSQWKSTLILKKKIYAQCHLDTWRRGEGLMELTSIHKSHTW